MLLGAILLLLGIAIGYSFRSWKAPVFSPKIQTRINKTIGRKQASIVDTGFIDLGIEENN